MLRWCMAYDGANGRISNSAWLIGKSIKELLAYSHQKHPIGCSLSHSMWLPSVTLWDFSKSCYWKIKCGVCNVLHNNNKNNGDPLTWMHGRWMPILLVSPAHCRGSFATFWSACWKRTRCPGVLEVLVAGCPADPCGETGVRAPGWTARFSPCGRRWEPRTLLACRRSEPGARAFWCRRCLMDFLTSRRVIYIWSNAFHWIIHRSAKQSLERLIVRFVLLLKRTRQPLTHALAKCHPDSDGSIKI